MKTQKFSYIIMIGLLSFSLFSGCHPGNKQDVKQRDISQTSIADTVTEKLKLRNGMQIKVSQKILMWGDPTTPWPEDPAAIRTIIIDNPSNSEGLSFSWQLDAKFRKASAPSDFNTAQAAQTEVTEMVWDGKMTLANMTNGQQMTLPMFWPVGELYLSNSSAIWLSDKAFEELKNNQQTSWNAGILGNPLLGPAQGLKMLENSIIVMNQVVTQNPELLKTVSQIVANKKLEQMKLKVNGQGQTVEVIEAKNWLADYKILNNAQNPLVLELRIAPDYNLGQWLFSPLLRIKALLEYRVDEIVIPTA